MKKTVNNAKYGVKSGPAESVAAFRSDFGDRFTALLNLFPSRAEAGEIAGVHPDQFPKYAREDVKLPLQVAAKLCAKKGVSLDWLVNGAGVMRAGFAQNPIEDDETVMVPVLDVRAGAGDEQWVDDEAAVATMALPRAYLMEHGISPASARLMTCVGDSMTPTIQDRGLMVVDISDQGERDAIYVIRRGSGINVKRLQHLASGAVVLMADNPAYQPETLPRDEADELAVLGRVGIVLRSI